MINAKGAFRFAIYQGGLNGALFVDLLKRLMYRRKKPLHLVIDGLPAHKNKVVKDYVASTDGRLGLHFLPGMRRICIPMNWSGAIPSVPVWRDVRCKRARNWKNACMTGCKRSSTIPIGVCSSGISL